MARTSSSSLQCNSRASIMTALMAFPTTRSMSYFRQFQQSLQLTEQRELQVLVRLVRIPAPWRGRASTVSRSCSLEQP